MSKKSRETKELVLKKMSFKLKSEAPSEAAHEKRLAIREDSVT